MNWQTLLDEVAEALEDRNSALASDVDEVSLMGRDEREGNFDVSVEEMIAGLNEALEFEYGAWLSYMTAGHFASSLVSEPIRELFFEHAEEEAEHAKIIARKIVTLGGVPSMNVRGLAAPTNLEESISRNLDLERDALAIYNKLIDMAGDNEALEKELQDIAAQEAEHAEELALLLRQL